MMQRTSRLLRELSHLTVVVQAPRPDSDVVEHLEFVRLREGQLLAVIAGSSGQIQNKLVPIDFPMPPGDLDRINNYLNRLVSGLTLDQVRARLVSEMASDRAAHDQLAARALQLAAAAVPTEPAPRCWSTASRICCRARPTSSAPRRCCARSRRRTSSCACSIGR